MLTRMDRQQNKKYCSSPECVRGINRPRFHRMPQAGIHRDFYPFFQQHQKTTVNSSAKLWDRFLALGINFHRTGTMFAHTTDSHRSGSTYGHGIVHHKKQGHFTGLIISRGSGRVRVTRTVIIDHFLTRPDPTRPVSAGLDTRVFEKSSPDPLVRL